MDLIGEERGRLARAATWLDASRSELVGLAVLLTGALVLTAMVVHSALGRPNELPTSDAAVAGSAEDPAQAEDTAHAHPAHDADAAGATGDAPAPDHDAQDLPDPTGAGSEEQMDGDGEVTVHVSGAVTTPGVVTLSAGSRVGEAVTAAGGSEDDADLSQVNLARRLEDGEQVHVPREGEEPRAAPPAGSAGTEPDATYGGTGGTGGASDGPIDLNRASPSELETLPGIGPAIAQRIIAHRDTHGPFATVGDLRDVSGIGEKRFQELAPLVTVG